MKQELHITATLRDRQTVGGRELYEWVAATGQEDVNGNIFDTAGWDLSHHLKFPLILLNHRIDELPIAKAQHTWVEGDQLRTQIAFLATPRATEVKALVDEGVITGMSYGARPLEWEFNIGAKGVIKGIHSHRHTLTELSIVTIPAGADSVLIAASLNATVRSDFLEPILTAIRSLKE